MSYTKAKLNKISHYNFRGESICVNGIFGNGYPSVVLDYIPFGNKNGVELYSQLSIVLEFWEKQKGITFNQFQNGELKDISDEVA